MSVHRTSRGRFGARRGNAMVEFGLCATLLTAVFTGVFQLGYSMYMYNELVEGVRAGTRYASLANISNAGDGTQPAAYTTAVKNMVVYGTQSPAVGQTPLAPSLTTGQVTVGVAFDSNLVPKTVTVNISSYTLDAILKTYTVTGKPSLTMPYFGQYCANGTAC